MALTTQLEPPVVAAVSQPVATPPARPAGPWVYSAWLDLLVGCGAWSAPLLLLAALIPAAHAHAWSVAFYALAIVFNYPHFMATEYRAYRSREDFQKYKFFTLHLTLLLALTGVLAHVFPRLLPWIFTLYICWSPWHYTGQNYGLLSMFVRRAGATIEAAERQWLRAAFIASYIMLLCSFETAGPADPLILSLGLPAKLTIPIRVALGIIFAACSWRAFRGLLRRSGWRAMAAPLTLLVTQFLWFVLPTLLEVGSAYQIPQTRYSSGILAILHSAQYLWITSYYQQRDARAAGQSAWRMSAYWIVLVAGGIALFIPGPWLVSYAFHFDFTTSFLIFTALVNIHHFMLDGAIWKLRDSRIASRLIGQSAESAAAKSKSKPRKTTPPSFARRVFGSPAFRFALIALLFLWGGTDQFRFAMGTDDGNLHALSRAASMIPYDSGVEQRIASTQSASGKPADAIDALYRAVSINPYSESAQQGLAKALIQDHRYEDAYAHYQKMLALFPRDADALLNYGLLATQLGHSDEAIDAWQRSLAADPTEINAHMYLASLLDQRGDYSGAVQHWYAYLQLAASHRVIRGANFAASSNAIVPSDEISALLQLSQDDARLNQSAAAITGYRSAASLAERAGDPKLESVALGRLAQAQDAAGDAKSAATSYQKSLALDAKNLDGKNNDPAGVASDWFNYAQFLLNRGKPPENAYACLLEAEKLVPAGPSDERSAIESAARSLESRLGAKAAAAAKKNQNTLLGAASQIFPETF